MACVKMAVSIRESLFKEAQILARQLKVSRSGLVSLAIERLLEERNKAEFARKVNEAYSEPMDEEERAFVRASMASLAELNRDDKW